MINSHLHPYTNLVNNILLLEQFNHLKYILNDYYDKDYKKIDLGDKVFYQTNNDGEELWWPTKYYIIDPTSLEFKGRVHVDHFLYDLHSKFLFLQKIERCY